MRCKACDRIMEVKWTRHEGCSDPVLEELCSVCIPWSKAVLRNAEDKEEAAYWPASAGLPGELMVAHKEAAAGPAGHWDISRWGDVPSRKDTADEVDEDE